MDIRDIIEGRIRSKGLKGKWETIPDGKGGLLHRGSLERKSKVVDVAFSIDPILDFQFNASFRFYELQSIDHRARNHLSGNFAAPGSIEALDTWLQCIEEKAKALEKQVELDRKAERRRFRGTGTRGRRNR